MSKISTEELAQSLEPIMIGPPRLAPLTNAEYNACSDALTEAAARLRALAEDAERLDTEVDCPMCGGRGVVDTEFKCVVDGVEDSDDTCVLDENRPQDCVHARPGMRREECQYWIRIPADKARHD